VAAIDEKFDMPVYHVPQTSITSNAAIMPETTQRANQVEEELKHIKSILNQMMNHEGKKTEIVTDELDETLMEMIFRKNDLDHSIAAQLIAECSKLPRSVHGAAGYEAEMREMIKLCFENNIIIKPYDPKQKIIVFVGPTGVGKTTTIAKLAARATLNEGKSVGLISADTYRIAAVEQLRTYSDILNIPLHVIYQAAEVKDALGKLKHHDLIMIDTAGRSHRDDQQLHELKGLLDEIESKEIYLLLSCTTRQQDVRDILEKYKFLDDFKIIITKIDEAAAFGTLVNVPMLTHKPISFMTTGQSVPDDIEVVTVDKILNLLIKETLS
jgi:flagellar biosynthesis protein FlhF